jgi:hypothetical protein
MKYTPLGCLLLAWSFMACSTTRRHDDEQVITPIVAPGRPQSQTGGCTKGGVCLVFDTGPSWWIDPNKECQHWTAALSMARRMAGCADNYTCLDPSQKCQAAIRRCSPGCDVCKSLKPGQGPNSDFGAVRQPSHGTGYAATKGPGLFGGYDTRFDQSHVCSNAALLAKVMIHEAVHACRAAGGEKDLYAKDDPFQRGTAGCYANKIAPFEGDRQCGDPP